MMGTTKEEVLRHLKQLVGRKLAIARRAADLRGFHFGRVTEDGSRNQSQGEFVLHIQCPWRVEGPDGIVTGRSDLWEPADLPEKLDRDLWDYETNENLQDRRIGQLLGAYDPKTRSWVNSTRHLVVEAVEADDFGGAVLSLSGGYRIAIFPSGSTGEDWRFFRPSFSGHFVVAGGRVEELPDEAG